MGLNNTHFQFNDCMLHFSSVVL